MPKPDELDRLAVMGTAMRPDWPMEQLRSHLAANHGARGYQELAVALAWIAADPTADPTWLANDGPWWKASNPTPQPLITKAGQRQTCPEHNIPLSAGNCERCVTHASEHVPGRAAQLWAAAKRQEDRS